MITAADIERVRKKLGETQEQFGKRLGISQPTVHRWEQETPETPMAQRFLAIELKRWLPKNGRGA